MSSRLIFENVMFLIPFYFDLQLEIIQIGKIKGNYIKRVTNSSYLFLFKKNMYVKLEICCCVYDLAFISVDCNNILSVFECSH